MNLAEIERIMTGEGGINICPYCNTPFAPRTARQKTCGSEECKRRRHNDNVRANAKKKKSENPEEFRSKAAELARKWRRKQKALEKRDIDLKDLGEYWERQAEFDRKITEYGDRYGEVQAQKILANVPKIDVNLGGNKKDDTVHGGDKPE